MKSKAGFTPLHMAAQEGHEDCVEMLIERGADINVPANNGNNIFYNVKVYSVYWILDYN